MRAAIFTAALLVLGTLGGGLTSLTGMPLPWMIGSLVSSALLVGFLPRVVPPAFRFSELFRMVFIGAIGAMIGARVDAEVVTRAHTLLPSLLGVTLFVVLAHGGSFWVFRRLGGYDRATAFYCATPGGLIESIALGEAAGADLRLLTLQQFLRVILVVTTVPLGLSILHGEALGSSAGVNFTDGTPDLWSIPLLLGVTALGLVVGKLIRLPAWMLVGPLVVTAVLTGFGLVTLAPPGWVIGVAQVVIGVSLGVRFIGITAALLGSALGLALVSISSMLGIGVALSLILHRLTGQDVEVLVLSFAPGGVTEMGLVALSLQANPAVVAFHHLYRISLTVLEMSVLSRWFRNEERDVDQVDD